MGRTTLAAWRKAVIKNVKRFGLQRWDVHTSIEDSDLRVHAEVHCEGIQQCAWVKLTRNRAQGDKPEFQHRNADVELLFPLSADFLAVHEVLHILAKDVGFADLFDEMHRIVHESHERLPMESELAFERFLSAIAKGVLNEPRT